MSIGPTLLVPGLCANECFPCAGRPPCLSTCFYPLTLILSGSTADSRCSCSTSFDGSYSIGQPDSSCFKLLVLQDCACPEVSSPTTRYRVTANVFADDSQLISVRITTGYQDGLTVIGSAFGDYQATNTGCFAPGTYTLTLSGSGSSGAPIPDAAFPSLVQMTMP